MYSAQPIVIYMATGNFAAVEQRLADHLKAFLPAGAIQATWQGLEQQFGAFQGLGPTTAMQTPQGLEQVVTCVFVQADVEVKMVLNGAGQITALTMPPASPPTPPAGQPLKLTPYRRNWRGSGGYLPWLALFVLTGGGAWLLLVHTLHTNPSFAAFYSSNGLIIEYLVVVLLFVSVILAGAKGHTALGKPLKAVPLVMVWIFIVNLLVGASFIPRVDLTRTGFSISYVSIVEGGTVTFDNPSDGVTQVLCLGTDQQCDPYASSSLQLAQGLVLHPGQSVSIVFSRYGTYQITSKTTPHMNLTIYVTARQCKSAGSSRNHYYSC